MGKKKEKTQVEVIPGPETQIQKRKINYVIDANISIDESIKQISELCMPMKVKDANDKAGYAIIRKNRIKVKGVIAIIENQRKEKKAEALDYNKRVDAESNRIKGLLEPIRDHLIV